MGYRRTLLMLLLGVILGGCHASPWATSKNDSPAADNGANAAANANKIGPNASAAKNAANGGVSQSAQKSSDSTTGNSTKGNPAAGETAAAADTATVNAQALQEAMAQVRELGVLDPQEQNKLLEDLKQTDPSLWPLMVKQTRAAVAYRRKSMDRGQTAAQGTMFASVPTGQSPRVPANLPDTEESPPQILQLGYNSADQAETNTSGAPGRLPALAKMAKSMPKNGSNAALSPEGAAGVAATNLAAGRKAGGTKSAAAKSRDIQSLDVKSLDAEDQATPVSYEIPNGAAKAARTGPAANAAAGASDGDPAAEESAQSSDWRGLMGQTIRALEADMPEKPKTAEDLSKQARLRMLYALAGRREDAAKPIPAAPPAMQDFWTKELYGLGVLLDTERTPDTMTRAAEAKQHLSEGFARLGEMAPLQARNLSFCTVVQSYGCYTPFKKYEFLPDQEVLLYAEVENFGIESTPKGYHTSLRSSYQILDKSGQRIADHAISTTEEYCQNPRRDFFIGYQLRMPPRINPGKYTLQLTIEDLKSQKVGQASVELTIKGGEKEKTER